MSNLLRLLVYEPEDFKIIATLLQGGLVQAGHMIYDRKKRSFVFECQRICWELPVSQKNEMATTTRCAIQINNVLQVQYSDFSIDQPELTYHFVTLFFEFNVKPDGMILILFEKGGKIKLNVECLDVMLIDLEVLGQKQI